MQLDQFDQGNDLDATPSRRGWYLAIIGTVAVLAAIIGVVAWTSDGDSKEEEDVAVVIPAKPDDGLDSVGVPVTVTPATELADIATVEVTASGFEPNESVGIVQCTTMASTLGQAGCDMNSLVSFLPVDATGTITHSFTVKRHIWVGGVEIDCGLGNVDPATWSSGEETGEGQFSCMVGVGAVQNYDRSGNTLIAFEGAVFGGPPPSIPTITTAPPGSDPMCPEGPESGGPCTPTTSTPTTSAPPGSVPSTTPSTTLSEPTTTTDHPDPSTTTAESSP